MPPQSIGNALIVTHHTVLMLAVMSPKDGIFCIGLYGESDQAHLFFCD